ncbi:ComEC/Rec2 family competence protein [Salinarimonas ramus]|uniref:Competence protein ComEC n=1 Tax=Salinarimonas ramus TaxID=690164 RepID=A0A917V322_9HYPH|nr:ComEC/Rec2 family competence protein [Salinarimonas ramus]GGK26808.1 competence protein ComEC [Salinarimonas ramus]
MRAARSEAERRAGVLAAWLATTWRRRHRLVAGPAAEVAKGISTAALVEIERRRLLPWGAVLFGLGILLFFGANARPSLPVGAVAGALALSAALAWARIRHRSLAGGIVLAGLAFLAAGFAAAAHRQASVAAPVLVSPASGTVAGFVESLEDRERGVRIVLRIAEHDLPVRGDGPLRVRATLRAAPDAPILAPGDWIVARVRLLPPPEAVRPGGYDFAKEAYFRGIGAVGGLYGHPEIAEAPVAPDLALRLAARLDAARNALTERIAGIVGGQPGAVAAALVTGKRGLIAEETNAVLRAAGVYHIVSISGLHMVLAAGTVFFGLRAVLAAFPVLALGWPIKKIAAAAAILAGAIYCVFSGSAVATERALIMTTIMFGAILVDRPALSMRNLALAALIVLAREPEALVGPSFQMSFSAVAGLIAGAEWQATRTRAPAPPPGRIGRALGAVRDNLMGIVVTTLIATAATGPFAAYHFQLANPYGLLGNVLALPVVTILVMPAAVIGMALLPLGLDALAWRAMGAGVGQVIAFSEAVAALPGSQVVVRAFDVGALGLLVGGLLVVTLSVSRLRLLALPLVAAGLALATAPARPDLYVDRDGRGVALRAADGRLVVLGDPGDFVLEQWLKSDGDPRLPTDPSLAAGVACDPLGCVAVLPGIGAIALVREPGAFAEDCARAAVVVARLTAPRGCEAGIVLDRAMLETTGAATLRFEADVPRLETVRRRPETRPWLARE